MRQEVISDIEQAINQSYDQLDGEWREWLEVAKKYDGKVPYQDRLDIRHAIIIELYHTRQKDGKPLPILRAYRIASLTVALYWRDYYYHTNGIDCGSCSKVQRHKCKQDDLYRECPKAIKIESLNKPILDSEGNLTELGELIADDKALDLDAWVSDKVWEIGYKPRLVEIAYKLQGGYPLDWKDYKYLQRYRHKEQKRLL